MRSLPSRSRRATVLVLLTAAMTFVNGSAALADATYSQNLAPGGSLSTASAVSTSDPVALTVTAPQGGNVRIDEASSPAQRLQIGNGEIHMDWVGPQFTVTAPNCSQGCTGPQAQAANQTVTITAILDAASLPAPPTRGANPQWRQHPETLCASQEGANLNFCKTTKAGIAQLCFNVTSSFGECNVSPNSSPPIVRPQLLGDGNVEIVMQLRAGGPPWTFDTGSESWSCAQTATDTVTVDAPRFPDGNLNDLIEHGVYYDDGCDLATTVSGEMTVTKAQARKLRLHSPVVGRISGGPGAGPIELVPAARAALRRHPQTVAVHVQLEAHGARPGETWSYDRTLEVKRSG